MGEKLVAYRTHVEQAWDAAAGGVEAAEPVRAAMEALFAGTEPGRDWTASLLAERPSRRELFRDAQRGFIQMGHVHPPGHATAPHDHGPGWVVYGVYQGLLEICTYRRRVDQDGTVRVAVETVDRLGSGMARAYLPGTIHSTRNVGTDDAVVFRFLSLDLEAVDRAHYGWDQVVHA